MLRSVLYNMTPGSKAFRLAIEISGIDVSDLLGLKAGSFRRYDAFHEGELFNAEALTITNRRIINEDIVSNTYFSTECQDEGTKIHQTVIGGPARSLRLGFGLNTEQYFITRVGWRNARLGPRASLVDLSLLAGYRIQQLTANLKWYYSDHIREYLRPSFILKHDTEQYFETNSLNVALASGRTWDDQDRGWQLEFGPQAEFDNTVVGVGAPNSRSWLFDTNIQVMSHDFEYYKNSPQSGYRVSLDGAFSNKDLGSTVTAQKYC